MSAIKLREMWKFCSLWSKFFRLRSICSVEKTWLRWHLLVDMHRLDVHLWTRRMSGTICRYLLWHKMLITCKPIFNLKNQSHYAFQATKVKGPTNSKPIKKCHAWENFFSMSGETYRKSQISAQSEKVDQMCVF